MIPDRGCKNFKKAENPIFNFCSVKNNNINDSGDNVNFSSHISKDEFVYFTYYRYIVPENLSIFRGNSFKKYLIFYRIKSQVKGEAKQIFIKNNAGLYYEPEDEKDLAEKIITT